MQLKRGGIEPLLVEKDEVGGLLRNAHEVENYPGFPEGIGGVQLAERFRSHLAAAGVPVSREAVTRLEWMDGSFRAITDRREIHAGTTVIASGTIPQTIPELVVDAEARNRVCYEARELFDLRNGKVAIIGAGDAAFDYALSMSASNDVLILNRGESTRCLPLLRERCEGEPRVTYMDNVRVEAVKSTAERIVLHCAAGEGRREIEADYLLIAVGREPCLEYLGAELKENLETAMSRGALYMIGDVKNETFRQTAICVGDGVRAALEICRKAKDA
jgi:thioredoxin reductase